MAKLRAGFFMFVAVLVLPAWAGQSLPELKLRVWAPEFTLEDMDGKTHRVADYRGKIVIVNFWATWCPPCRAELPSMNRAWAKVKGEDIEMLAINVGEDEETVFTFLGDHPIDFTVLLDKAGEIINSWPVRGLPTTFVLDPEGRLVYRVIGTREWDDDQLLEKIRMLGSERTGE